MEYSREEKEMRQFSRTTLLFVTGSSFIIFSFFLKLMDGTHSLFLLRTGFACLGLGACSVLYNFHLLSRKEPQADPTSYNYVAAAKPKS